ncbi:MAG: hypothetical protein Q9195_009478 [Heterodermia aff. obscurata]
MSGLEIIAAITGVIGAFKTGYDVFQDYRRRRREKRTAQAAALEDSLATSHSTVQRRHNEGLMAFGPRWRSGDDITVLQAASETERERALSAILLHSQLLAQQAPIQRPLAVPSPRSQIVPSLLVPPFQPPRSREENNSSALGINPLIPPPARVEDISRFLHVSSYQSQPNVLARSNFKSLLGFTPQSAHKPPPIEIGMVLAIEPITALRVEQPGYILPNIIQDSITGLWKRRSGGLLRPVDKKSVRRILGIYRASKTQTLGMLDSFGTQHISTESGDVNLRKGQVILKVPKRSLILCWNAEVDPECRWFGVFWNNNILVEVPFPMYVSLRYYTRRC